MKKKGLFIWGIIFAFLFLPSITFGSGFAINETDTRAVGMAGAFAAQANNPSAVYFNPAGIVQLEGTQLSTGFSLISPSATFTNAATGLNTDLESTTFFIPNFFITHKLNDKCSIGLGAFSNFGLGTDWPDNWAGRYFVGGTKAEVETLSLNPVIAFRPIERLSLSVGFIAQYLDINLENKLSAAPVPIPDGSLKLEKNKDWDHGYNLGLLFWITDELRFGASYRSRIQHKIDDGDVTISGFTAPLNALNDTTTASANLELPAVAYFALAWTRGPWTLEFDYHWTEWSSYDKLRVDFATPVLGGKTFTESDKLWDDVAAYRFGVEYQINELFDVRGGVIFDESPIPDETLDPMLPSGDRWLYCIGGSWHYKNFSLDVAYNYLDDDDRNSKTSKADDTSNATLPGIYSDVDAHIFMLNVSYAF